MYLPGEHSYWFTSSLCMFVNLHIDKFVNMQVWWIRDFILNLNEKMENDLNRFKMEDELKFS